jgi:hypothetical protein
MKRVYLNLQDRDLSDRTLIRRLPTSIVNYRWCVACMKWIAPGQPMLISVPATLFSRCARHFWKEYKAIWP